MTVSPFARLGLIEPILRALADCNYDTPTPIQARAIPILLQGRDLLGIAQTGTGKTAAFALPILQLMHTTPRRAEPKRPRGLVLAPTRELASQILEAFRTYGQKLPLRHDVVYGGVGMVPQVRTLQRGVDVLIATPGRLLDHMKQRNVDLSKVEFLVLDETDRMLDMGFVRDVERILSTLPKQRQSLLFSATMPTTVASLARNLLRTPERIEVTPPAATTERVEQSICFVTQQQKRDLLVRLLRDPDFSRTLVFSRTKHGADRVAKHLAKSGIEAKAIHGDKSQGQRERALGDFRTGKCQVLIATDLAARGIDVPEVSHVINFDLPNIPESYVHRIGRTARAGREGIAISFCSPEEREFLRDIEKLIRQKVPVRAIDGFAPPPRHQDQPEPVGASRGHGPRQRGGAAPAPRERGGHERSAPAENRPDWAEIARALGEPENQRSGEPPTEPNEATDQPTRHSHKKPHRVGRPEPRQPHQKGPENHGHRAHPQQRGGSGNSGHSGRGHQGQHGQQGHGGGQRQSGQHSSDGGRSGHGGGGGGSHPHGPKRHKGPASRDRQRGRG